MSRAGATVDASGAGVRLLSTSQSLSASNDGLVIAADDVTLRGMSIDDFSGAAVRVEGARAVLGGDAGAGQGIRVGGSGTGFALAGSDATVAGNVIGFAADGSAATVGIGIEISVGNATIGDDGQGAGFMNVVGNSDTAIRVGTGSEAAFGGTRIVRNVIGRGPDNSPAPVTTGIVIAQPSTGTLVQSNTIAYAATGISVAADVDGVSVTGNRFQQNTFQALSGMAIDLNADHTVNPNDEGDADTGPNGLINSPTFTRAIQSTLTGSAGPTCGGCTVQIYLAQHVPGGATDYGTVPVAGGTVVADATGHFTLDTPAVTAGQWITGLVTDAVGNTSEFGASTRVGAGVAQCGNVTLVPGWNHVGFFGAEPANLGSIFPESGESPGAVTAIYHLRDGSTDFDHWFASDSSDRTLNVLEPGEAYWFFAERAVTLTAGFSLSVPAARNPETGLERHRLHRRVGGREGRAPLGGRPLQRPVPVARGRMGGVRKHRHANMGPRVHDAGDVLDVRTVRDVAWRPHALAAVARGSTGILTCRAAAASAQGVWDGTGDSCCPRRGRDGRLRAHRQLRLC